MALGLDCLLVERFTGVVHNLLFHFKNCVLYDILKLNDIYLGRVIRLRQNPLRLNARMNGKTNHGEAR